MRRRLGLVVAAQISAQTSEPAVLAFALDQRQILWEADGLDQSLGEVLAILARDAQLVWQYWTSMNEKWEVAGPRTIWLVDRN